MWISDVLSSFTTGSLNGVFIFSSVPIAHGEYPVIIDMETYPGYLKQQSEKDGSSVEEKINKSTEIKLANSVIHTGMLPVLTWGRGNRDD